MTATARKTAKPAGNPVMTFLHLWLGLTLGLVLVMTGLTGSYLAFYPQIEQAALPTLREAPGVRPVSLEAAYVAFTRIGPEADGAWHIEVPENGGVITARHNTQGDGQRMVSINPSTFRVIRDVQWGGTVSTWLYDLHVQLLMGRTGGAIMGWLAVGMLVAVIIGAILWWTLGRDRAGRFTFDLKGLSARQIYDQHRLLGLVASVFLVIVLVTAVMMNLPGQTRPILAAVSPITTKERPKSTPVPGGVRIPVDLAIAIANAELPGAKLTWVQVPNQPTGVYGVRFWQKGEPSRRFPQSYVWVDQFSGKVLGKQDGLAGTASDKVLRWLFPLHGGEAFGLLGRIFMVVLGFVPAILYVTGFVRWRQKERIKARKAAKPSEGLQPAATSQSL